MSSIPEHGFFAPKMANGKWVEPFDPQLSGGIGSRSYFAENNAWTWNFSVQQDIPDLIQLLGGKQAFIKRLDALFNEPSHISKWQFMGKFPDASGLNGMFVAGNEPSFHIPYLYDYAGQPWKTQRRIREIMDMWFDDRPLGIPGDEDGGALCSWYVFSAMGFFPVTPGSGMYAIGSPVFNSVRIQLPNGKTFSVIAQNCSKKNKYIQSAKLNGKELKTPFIRHADIALGEVNLNWLWVTVQIRAGELNFRIIPEAQINGFYPIQLWLFRLSRFVYPHFCVTFVPFSQPLKRFWIVWMHYRHP